MPLSLLQYRLLLTEHYLIWEYAPRTDYVSLTTLIFSFTLLTTNRLCE